LEKIDKTQITSRQLAVGCWQLAVGSWQSKKYKLQITNRQAAVGSES